MKTAQFAQAFHSLTVQERMMLTIMMERGCFSAMLQGEYAVAYDCNQVMVCLAVSDALLTA